MNALRAYFALVSSVSAILLEAGFDWLQEWTETWARMVAGQKQTDLITSTDTTRMNQQ